MASNWRPASIPLTGGLNTTVSAKRLGPGQFSQLDNAVFDGEGCPSKRHGSTADQVLSVDAGLAPAVDERTWIQGYGYVPTATLTRLNLPSQPGGPGETGSVRGLATRDGELLAWDGTHLCSRSPSLGRGWVGVPNGMTQLDGTGRGTVLIPHLTTRQSGYAKDASDMTGLDVAVGEDIRVVAWADSGELAVLVSAFESDSNAPIFSSKDLTTGITFTGIATCRLAYVPTFSGTVGYFVLAKACGTTGDLAVSVALETDILDWTTTVVTASLYSAGLSIRTFGGKAYLSWVTTAGDLHLTSVDEYAAVVDTVQPVGTTINTDSATDLAFHPDGRLMMSFFDDVAGDGHAWVIFFASNLASVDAGPIQVSTAGMDPGAYAITCEWSITKVTNRSAKVFWSGNPVGGAGTASYFARVENTTVTRSLDSGADVFIIGQAFRTGDSVGCAILVNDGVSEMQAIVYWDNLTVQGMVPCAVFGRGTSVAGRLTTVGSICPLPGQDSYNPQKFSYCQGVVKNNGSAAESGGMVTIDLDFGAPLRSAQAGRSTYFAGGFVREYDGATVHEAGFAETVLPTLTPAGSGSLTPSSTYTYRVYLCHRNAQNETVRSSAITKTVVLAAGEDEVLITLPAIYLTTRPNLFWEVYRSQGNGSVLTLSLTYNNFVRGQTETISDTASDAVIAQSSIDPIPAATVNGIGVLDGVSPPACTVIGAGKDRLWFAGGELGMGQLAYSRFYDPGEGVTWNEALVVETDRVSEVTGLGFMGDWVIALSRTRIHYVAGDGPSNLGQGDFFPSRLVVSDLGALTPESVVLTPMGLAFQSPQGVRVLGQGGALMSTQTGFLGSEVDASFAGQTCLGSCVIPEQGHARWLLDDGTQMVWDYAINKWARWTGYHVTPELGDTGGLTYLPGGSVIACQSEVWTETASVYTDGGHPYQFIASMGWVNPHGPLSWGRLRRWALEGDALGDCTMRIFIDYDFKLSRRQGYTWLTSTLSTRPDGQTYDHDPAGWGDEASWGAGPVWGGDTADGGAFPVNVRFNRSQATSFRMTFTDETEPNQTLTLRSLSIEFSPKAGLVRAGGRNI